jgi:hypothetical protein
MGYKIEARLLRGDKRIDGVVVEEYVSWIPIGDDRPTLDQAKAAAEALRGLPTYSSSPIRIMQGEEVIVEVKPDDPPLVVFG